MQHQLVLMKQRKPGESVLHVSGIAIQDTLYIKSLQPYIIVCLMTESKKIVILD